MHESTFKYVFSAFNIVLIKKGIIRHWNRVFVRKTVRKLQ